jgi:hypothetical protein
MSIFYCNHITPLWLSFSPLTFQQLSVNFIILSSYTDTMYFETIHNHFLFLSHLPLVLSNSLTTLNMAPLSMCIYNYVCICVYINLLGLSSTYERKYGTFVFLNLDYCA